ncbi:MAG: glycosyltransferase [Spirochaetes bacterium]|nr:glycosyltransferase [Spirochaetota bacterium]
MKRENTLLAIAMPTYNRAAVLERSLSSMIPVLSRFNVPVYISDNHSSDSTGQVVEELRRKYPFIHYSSNRTNILDLNYFKALSLPRTRYVWLLSDKFTLYDESFTSIFQVLENNDLDALIVNNSDRVRGIESRFYTDKNELLMELGWHTTLVSSTIYNRRMINRRYIERYFKAFFLQVGLLFEYLASKKQCNVYFDNNNAFYSATDSPSVWRHRPFEIFLQNWVECVLSLPYTYTLKSRLSCIRAHSRKSALFSSVSLIDFRLRGSVSLGSLFEYRNYIRLAMDRAVLAKVIAYSLVPRSVFAMYMSLRKFARGLLGWC